MNSIDKNQAGANKENVSGKQAIEKIRQLSEGQSCFFCTVPVSPDFKDTPPMFVHKIDEDDTLWFLAPDDSPVVAGIRADPAVKLFFKGPSHSDFLMLIGKASLSKDEPTSKELWQSVMTSPFTESGDDPQITLIRVKAHDGYYWDTENEMMAEGTRMLIDDDSIQEDLKV